MRTLWNPPPHPNPLRPAHQIRGGRRGSVPPVVMRDVLIRAVYSGDLVDRDRLRYAAQFAVLRHRPDPARGKHVRGLRVIDDRTRRVDRARGGKALHPRGDVDGLAEIILA